MLQTVKRWLTQMWLSQEQTSILEAYRVTFSTHHGQIVLQHMMDEIYCKTYEGGDPNGALIHNAKREIVHSILLNIDVATNPSKYAVSFQERSAAQEQDLWPHGSKN